MTIIEACSMKEIKLLKSIKIIIVIMIISAILSIVTINEFNKEELDNPSNFYDKNLKTENINENPIYIDAKAKGINAHNWTWAASQYWCNGSGSQQDPYRISYLSINGMGINNCIEIRNSDLIYFTIEHCILYNAGNSFSNKYAANIFLNNSNNGMIFSNNITGATSELAMGIYIENCIYMEILSNNIIENRFNGILIHHSYASNISFNSIKDNKYMGLAIQDNSQTISIDNNLIINNYDGIGVVGSSHNWIWDNTIKDNYINGIICVDCYRIDIQFNTVSQNSYCGIYIQESNVIDILGNMINNNGYGIVLKLSSSNNIKINRIFNNNYYPLWLYSSNYNYIFRNTITNNKDTIVQIECVGNELVENTIFNQPEQQVLTTIIILIATFAFAAVIFFRKRLKRNS